MIIVTGGAGFIGSNLIKALNEKGITNILVIDNLKNGYKIKNLVDLKISDFLDKEDFLIKVKTGKSFGYIEAIFHEGACSITTSLDGKYMMSNNYQYSKELLHYCLDRNIPLLYASSAAVYGNGSSSFFESSKCEKPLSIYAYSKLLFDNYVRQFLLRKKSQIVGFRYFNVYGPREEHKGDMASIVFRLDENLKNGKSLKLFEGSKNYKRDFIFISDVVEVNLWFLENGVSGIFNLGTGHAESFQILAENILNFYKKGDIKYVPFPQKLKGFYQKFTQANLKTLREAGYKKPFKTLNEGITEYLSWLNCKNVE